MFFSSPTGAQLFKRVPLLLGLISGFLLQPGIRAETPPADPAKAPPGMVWIASGEFTMGTDDDESYPVERPAHRVTLDGFWMDATVQSAR